MKRTLKNWLYAPSNITTTTNNNYF